MHVIMGEKSLVAIYYLSCQKISIQLNVFHKRAEFYWISGSNSKNSKWFGDVSRGIEK